jgi:hypothetical protein
MKQLTNDLKLNEMLIKHDRFYEYSDDMGKWSKGKDERQAILAYMINNLNMSLTEASDLYSNYVNGKL